MITIIRKIIGKQKKKELEGWEQYLRPIDGETMKIDENRNKNFVLEER